MPPTPTTRRKNSSARKTTTPARSKQASARPATPTAGLVGTAAKMSKEGQALVSAIKKAAKGEVTLRDYGGGNEVMVKIGGRTAAYLIQKEDGTLTARYTQLQPPLNIRGIGRDVTVTQAASEIAKHVEARPARASRGAAAAPSRSKSVSKNARSKTARAKTGRSKTGNGQGNLANGLRGAARRAGSKTTSQS